MNMAEYAASGKKKFKIKYTKLPLTTNAKGLFHMIQTKEEAITVP